MDARARHVRPHLRARHAAWSRSPCRGGRDRPEHAALLRRALRRHAAEEAVRYSRLVILLSMAVLVLASLASAQQAGEPPLEAGVVPLPQNTPPGLPRGVKDRGLVYPPPASRPLAGLRFHHR